jgi:hypothetical protein
VLGWELAAGGQVDEAEAVMTQEWRLGLWGGGESRIVAARSLCCCGV